MKKALFRFVVVAFAAIAISSCGGKGSASPAGEEQAEAVVPEGYKTHEFAHYSISVPEEFATSGESDYGGTTTVRFSSESMLKLDDGTEVSSSATIDCGSTSDGAKPAQVSETASTMKASQEAAGETCDEPVIDGNIILMRHCHDIGDGQKGITWRWWIVSESGVNVSGNIFYPETQSKYYDGVAEKIVKTIRIK